MKEVRTQQEQAPHSPFCGTVLQKHPRMNVRLTVFWLGRNNVYLLLTQAEELKKSTASYWNRTESLKQKSVNQQSWSRARTLAFAPELQSNYQRISKDQSWSGAQIYIYQPTTALNTRQGCWLTVDSRIKNATFGYIAYSNQAVLPRSPTQVAIQYSSWALTGLEDLRIRVKVLPESCWWSGRVLGPQPCLKWSGYPENKIKHVSGIRLSSDLRDILQPAVELKLQNRKRKSLF